MNKEIINTYLSNKKIWRDIEITEEAVKQILFLINLNSNNRGIKLGVKKSGCAGFRYTMILLTDLELKKEQDLQSIIFFYKKILICISSKDTLFLEGVKIDFITNNINKVFKFYNKKWENFCGCGESFAINEKLYHQHNKQ